MGKIGGTLKKARESKGLTLQQIEDETNMRWKYLEALEEENYEVIPGQAYVRGFLRNYAAFLGLEPDEMLEQYRLEIETSPGKETERTQDVAVPKQVILSKPLLAVIAVFSIILIAAASWAFLGKDNPPENKTPVAEAPPNNQTPADKPPAAQPKPNNPSTNQTPQPTQPTPTPAPVQPSVQGVALKLTASGQCWLAVYADGKQIYEGFINKGEIKTYNAANIIAIRYGNAGVVDVEYQGKSLGKAGGLGKVVNQQYPKS